MKEAVWKYLSKWKAVHTEPWEKAYNNTFLPSVFVLRHAWSSVLSTCVICGPTPTVCTVVYEYQLLGCMFNWYTMWKEFFLWHNRFGKEEKGSVNGVCKCTDLYSDSMYWVRVWFCFHPLISGLLNVLNSIIQGVNWLLLILNVKKDKCYAINVLFWFS